MSASTTTDLEPIDRHASLKLGHSADGQHTLSARVPLNCSEEDFLRVSRTASASSTS